MPTRTTRRRSLVAAVVVALVVTLAACSGSSGTNPPSSAPATSSSAGAGVDARTRTAIDAYVYGYPLVALARTRSQLLCLGKPNTLVNSPALSTPAMRAVVSPNVDTLYSIGWLDLRQTPVLLSVPAVPDRYYTFQLLDMYSNTFINIGTRQTGTGAGQFAIVGPGFSGPLPAGVQRVDAPTPDVWLLGRTLATSTADVSAVNAVQKQYQLAPLPASAGTSIPVPTSSAATSPAATPAPAPPGCGANLGSPQDLASAGAGFFDELGSYLAADPAPAADRAQLDRFATLGIGPGQKPSTSGDPAAVARLATAARLGDQQITQAVQAGQARRDGWSVRLDIGTYGQNYLVRAATAKAGLGANVPAESVYYFGTADAGDRPLTGTSNYRMHFDAGQLPPVAPKGFWSVTLYDADHFLVENPLKRYAIGDRTPGLQKNPDGSLDLYIGNTTPAGHESNWLPAPAGAFNLILRGYIPQPAVLQGQWTPPGVEPIS